jgi:hypothetical protein
MPTVFNAADRPAWQPSDDGKSYTQPQAVSAFLRLETTSSGKGIPPASLAVFSFPEVLFHYY